MIVATAGLFSVATSAQASTHHCRPVVIPEGGRRLVAHNVGCSVARAVDRYELRHHWPYWPVRVAGRRWVWRYVEFPYSRSHFEYRSGRAS
jgi:hypothetical protein